MSADLEACARAGAALLKIELGEEGVEKVAAQLAILFEQAALFEAIALDEGVEALPVFTP
jgi:uncharacterized protein involved in propanediol utilization